MVAKVAGAMSVTYTEIISGSAQQQGLNSSVNTLVVICLQIFSHSKDINIIKMHII